MNKNKKKTILFFIIICIVCVALGILLALKVIPKITEVVSNWGNNEILALLTLFGVIAALSAPFIEEHFHKVEKKTVYTIDIAVKVLANNFVRFSASIENVGDKTINTNISNLYIDQGTQIPLKNDRDQSDAGAVQYDFPFILEHKEYIENRPDCILCKKCFRDKDENYPEDIVDQRSRADSSLLRTHVKLNHLSNKSVMYIQPKERFSEDIILQFKHSGVYRVTLFVGCNGDADCECATKQFYIENDV